MPAGRPAHAPAEKDRKTVESLAGFGISEEKIARLIGVDAKTLRKYYRNELDLGSDKANSTLAQKLYRIATGSSPQAVNAAKFWLACRAGWKEQVTITEIASKKEEREWAAKRAGLGSEWGDDLITTPTPSRNEVN